MVADGAGPFGQKCELPFHRCLILILRVNVYKGARLAPCS